MSSSRRHTLSWIALPLTGLSLLFALILVSVSSGTLPIGGPISAGGPLSDRGVEPLLIASGSYQTSDESGATAERTFGDDRVLLGARDGKGWLVLDATGLRHYPLDPRITPLAPPPLAREVRIALSIDRRGVYGEAAAGAQIAIEQLLPLYAALYTGGALQIRVNYNGEIAPPTVSYQGGATPFAGPDVSGARTLAGDRQIGLIAAPLRIDMDLVRGYATMDPLDLRPAAFVAYLSAVRLHDELQLSFGSIEPPLARVPHLRGVALLRWLDTLPDEMNSVAARAWHETLHGLEWLSLSRLALHDYARYGHGRMMSALPDHAISERSWYALMSYQLLGEKIGPITRPTWTTLPPAR